MQTLWDVLHGSVQQSCPLPQVEALVQVVTVIKLRQTLTGGQIKATETKNNLINFLRFIETDIVLIEYLKASRQE